MGTTNNNMFSNNIDNFVKTPLFVVFILNKEHTPVINFKARCMKADDQTMTSCKRLFKMAMLQCIGGNFFSLTLWSLFKYAYYLKKINYFYI
jgi:hypothetical protein